MKELTLSTLLLFSMMTPVFAQERYGLRLNLKKGQTSACQVAANNPITISMMGQQVEMKQTQTITYIYKMLDVRDGNYLVEINISRVQATSSITGEMMNMSVDTDSNDKDEMINRLRKAANQRVTQWVNAKLRFLGEPEGETVDDLVKRGAITMAMVPVFFPARPVARGESFTVNSPLLSGEDTNIKYGGVATLVTVSDIDYTFRVNDRTAANFEGLVIEGNAIDSVIPDCKTGMIKNIFGIVSLRGSGNMQGT